MWLNTPWTSNFECDETTQSINESQEVHKCDTLVELETENTGHSVVSKLSWNG